MRVNGSRTWALVLLCGLVGCVVQPAGDDGEGSSAAGTAADTAVAAGAGTASAGIGGESGTLAAGTGASVAGSAGNGVGGAGVGGANGAGASGGTGVGGANGGAGNAGAGGLPAAGTMTTSGSDAPMPDAGPMDDVDAPPAGTLPIDAPVADDCITDVSAGDHTFTCQGIQFLVMVDERCTEFACGLIFDVHGATMSGAIMRANNRLHELAPAVGYLTVHPTKPGGTWDLVADPPILADFMQRMIAAFHAEKRRVHMTGFSMGSGMTFWFLCNHPDWLASTGPVTGASAAQTVVEATGEPCIESIDADWAPRVPILFMSGSQDGALAIEDARARADGIVSRLSLTGGDEIEGDATYSRKRWDGEGGMVFDFLEHDYSNAIIQGHCIPGGSPTDLIYACTQGGDSLDWGPTVLQWFVEHPQQP